MGVFNQELTKYIITGIFNTFVGYVAFILFLNVFELTPEFSNVLSYFIALTIAYLLNKYFVFNQAAANVKTIYKFVISFLFAYSVNLAAFSILYRLYGIAPEVAQIVAMVFYTVVFYVLNKQFVFSIKDYEEKGG